MGADSRAPELQRVIERLPAGFDALREEARAEGYLFVERLAADWEAGRMRFGDNGETLLAARVAGVLAGFGGLTIEPILPGALRVRRFYVRARFRRAGIGRTLATGYSNGADDRPVGDRQRSSGKRFLLGIAGFYARHAGRTHAPLPRVLLVVSALRAMLLPNMPTLEPSCFATNSISAIASSGHLFPRLRASGDRTVRRP